MSVYCVSISVYISSNVASVQEQFLGSNFETQQSNVYIVPQFYQGLSEQNRIQNALRKKRTVKYSDNIYFPGETNAKTTTKKPIVPDKVNLRKRIIINNGLCPKRTKSYGAWCVPDDGDDYDYN